MKTSISPHLLWAPVAVFAFVVGFWIGTPSAGEHERESVAQSASQPSQKAGPADLDIAPIVSSPRDGAPSIAERASAPLTGAEAKQAGYRLLGEPKNRVARARALAVVLAQVNTGNWRDVLEGFERSLQGNEQGGGETYSILLEHIGAVAGAEALKDSLSPEKVANRTRMITMLKGWADADPKACLAWYQAQPPEIQKGYLGHFVAGLARNDPQSALELTFRKESAFLGSGTATAVVNNAVSVLGVQAVDALFLTMRDRPDITSTAKRAFFSNLLNKELPAFNKAKDPAPQVLEWFKSHAGHDYVGANETSRIIGQAAKADPVATISWLDAETGRMTSDQAIAGYMAVAPELQRQSPKQFDEWLATRTTSPHRDAVIGAALENMVQSADYPGALKMAAAIGDEQMRTRVISAIQQQQSGQPQPAR